MFMAVVQDTHSATSSSGVVKRARRGNGRAWRPEEEEYLRRARGRGIPYKQIAAHLNKTDLACRLHYHQIHSFNRRQTSLAVGGARMESLSPSYARQDPHSRLATPSITVSYSASPRTTYSTSPASMSTKSYTSPATSVATEWCSPQMSQACHTSANVHNYGIGLNLQDTSSSPALAPPAVCQAMPDIGRLLYDHADHSRALFSALANHFPQSPAELEAAFRAALCPKSSSPLPQPQPYRPHLAPLAWPHPASEFYHPRGSAMPQALSRDNLLAPSPKRCTVSSLLNFEKDAVSQKWGLSGA